MVTRQEMRRHNLWHRSTSIFVIDEHHKFCVNKRSKNKDYYPGYLDLVFGGIVAADEMADVDNSALREAEEEMGIPNLSKIKVPGSQMTLAPKFVFKHQMEIDDVARAWIYTYYIPWHSCYNTGNFAIKPQQTEIDHIIWMPVSEI